MSSGIPLGSPGGPVGGFSSEVNELGAKIVTATLNCYKESMLALKPTPMKNH